MKIKNYICIYIVLHSIIISVNKFILQKKKIYKNNLINLVSPN